jgi:cytochrome c556
MKKVVLLGLVTVAGIFASPAFAQFQKPEDAVKYRQSALFVMSQHFGRVGAMASGRAPFDAKVAAENAEIVAEMAKLPWAGFVAGADSRRAKPEIWKDSAKFKEASDKLVAETAKLSAAAKTGSLDNVKVAFGAVGGACKSCHDAFRND